MGLQTRSKAIVNPFEPKHSRLRREPFIRGILANIKLRELWMLAMTIHEPKITAGGMADRRPRILIVIDSRPRSNQLQSIGPFSFKIIFSPQIALHYREAGGAESRYAG